MHKEKRCAQSKQTTKSLFLPIPAAFFFPLLSFIQDRLSTWRFDFVFFSEEMQMLPCKLKPHVACLSWRWRRGVGLQPLCCRKKFSGEWDKVTALKRAIVDHSSFCSEETWTFLLSFYFPFLGEFSCSYVLCLRTTQPLSCSLDTDADLRAGACSPYSPEQTCCFYWCKGSE